MSVRVPLLVCFACILLVGCDRSASSAGNSTGAAAKAADPLHGAPPDWSEFRTWAETILARPPEEIPLPKSPVLPSPKWPAQRLIPNLAKARVESSWSPPEQSDDTLQSAGPFRSDTPTSTFRASRNFDRKLGLAMEMHIRAFDIECAEVGAIELQIHAPWGEHIDLIWSLGGQIRIPVPDNSDFWTLTVATDGMIEWVGHLDTLVIRTDGYPADAGVFELRSVKLLGHENLYPKAVDAGRVAVNRVRRDALYAHGSSIIEYVGVKLGEKTALQFGVACAATSRRAKLESIRSPQANFEVVVKHSAGTESVFSESAASGANWRDARVSLERWAGQEVTIQLRSSAPDGQIALWSAPILYEPAANPPIFVIYLIDTLAARHMGVYGHSRPTTPHLDALAQRGVWFREMRTNAPVTVASLPHLMLSLTTERHGVYQASIGIPFELVTMADSLQAAGFATGSFVTSEFAGPRQNMDQGFDHFVDEISLFWRDPMADRTVPIDAVRTFLESNRDRPAFVYIHTAEPHAPYFPPPGFAGTFDTDYGGQINGSMDQLTGFLASKTDRDIEHVRALYDEEVLYADSRFGKFEDALRNAGLLDRTTFLITADHGEELMEHGNWGHGPALYEEVLRIPLILAGPLVTQQGRVDNPVCMYDVLPTVLDLFELPQPYALEGASLAALLTPPKPHFGKPPQAERVLIVAHCRNKAFGILDYSVTEALEWKLLLRSKPHGDAGQTVEYELYNLKSDPLEKSNVINEKPEIARRLLEKLIRYHHAQRAFARSSGDALRYDPKQLHDIRGMGYIK